MNKKEYISPELELIKLHTMDILANSPIIPHDPENPVVSGDKGLDGDL